jgi:acetyl esterase/lipase
MKNFFKINVALFLAIIFTVTLFSQQQSYEEHVFVYKVVQGHEIKANIFIPKTEHKHPVCVYFHGGGFIFGNRDAGLPDALRDKLLAHDYAIVSADYRLAPETKLTGITADVRDVVKWIRENGAKQFQIDENEIAVSGGSAGGYLAITTGYNVDPPVEAIIAISAPTGFTNMSTQMGDTSILKQPGPYDIVKDSIVSYSDYSARVDLWRFLSKNRLGLYEIFGFDVSKDSVRLQTYTLSNHIKKGYPPTLIVHAKNDHLVDFSQAEKFYKLLQDKGVESELFTVENGHSGEVINNYPEAVDKIIQFLDARLK